MSVPDDMLAALVADDRCAAHQRLRAKARVGRPLPDDLPDSVRACVGHIGIVDLHAFQREAIDLLRRGTHVVLAGGTGAGKSLCYQLPILEALARPHDERLTTALYLAPTKALAQDQARRIRELAAPWAVPMLHDGDQSPAQRAQVKRRGRFVLTNPDMLHASMLPRHEEWATFFRGLTHVVIDEAHVYRGVFGSHVAQVMRRLRRVLAAHDNTSCTFTLSSATIGNPVDHAQRLVGVDVALVGDAGAPRSARDVVLMNPALDEDTGARDSAIGDAARLYADLVAGGVSTIVFTPTRRSCELVHRIAQQHLAASGAHDCAQRIAPYRGGYAPAQRRETERALASGELVGVVATSALELGIDVGSLDAAIVVTFPGTTTSLLQRFGRAGRRATGRGLCILVAGPDALDQHFMRHPEDVLCRTAEDAVVSVDNPRIVTPQLAAAAAEAPLGSLSIDDELWDEPLRTYATSQLLHDGSCVMTPRGLVFTGSRAVAPSISLRAAGAERVAIVDVASGELLGDIELARAPHTVHPGAVYLHRGDQYLVAHLDTRNLIAHVQRADVDWYTMPHRDTQIHVLDTIASRPVDSSAYVISWQSVRVRDQVIGYQRIDARTHRPIARIDAALPQLTFDTEALSFASPICLADAAHASAPTVQRAHAEQQWLLGSLHAAEHVLIAMLPLIATCDRWDIGGLSIDLHAEFDGAGIFIYDGHAGGVGLVEAGFGRFEEWARAALEVTRSCPCRAGCPACVHSPKCGNLNEPLDKAGAALVLDRLLRGDDA